MNMLTVDSSTFSYRKPGLVNGFKHTYHVVANGYGRVEAKSETSKEKAFERLCKKLEQKGVAVQH